jgi:ribonuclease BN (tRNA processing enzyme)
LEATIWGCRGSLPTPGPATLEYGGNTSCVEVNLADGTVVVLDAGSGIHALGLERAEPWPDTIHLCLTHLHLDHLEGLAFFAPLWESRTELHVWGPPSPLTPLERRVARYFSPPLFPIQLSDVPARLSFHDVPPQPWEIGSARVRAEPVAHPGPTLGYRIDEGGKALTFIPDHEPARGLDLESVTPDWISGFSLAEGADVLLHDAQYFEAEYAERVGWGHSSVADAVQLARIADVGGLVLFHHDPLHADDRLRELEQRARELWGNDGTPPRLARERMTISL